METIEIELLLILILGVCLEAYLIGKKKKFNLLRCIGKSGAILSFILIIVNLTLIILRRRVD